MHKYKKDNCNIQKCNKYNINTTHKYKIRTKISNLQNTETITISYIYRSHQMIQTTTTNDYNKQQIINILHGIQ